MIPIGLNSIFFLFEKLLDTLKTILSLTHKGGLLPLSYYVRTH